MTLMQWATVLTEGQESRKVSLEAYSMQHPVHATTNNTKHQFRQMHTTQSKILMGQLRLQWFPKLVVATESTILQPNFIISSHNMMKRKDSLRER